MEPCTFESSCCGHAEILEPIASKSRQYPWKPDGYHSYASRPPVQRSGSYSSCSFEPPGVERNLHARLLSWEPASERGSDGDRENRLAVTMQWCAINYLKSEAASK